MWCANVTADVGALRRESIKFWLAVVGETNYRLIEKLNFPFYALDIKKDKFRLDIHEADKLVLYKAGAGGGFAGIFVVNGEPFESRTRVFPTKLFPLRIPLMVVSVLHDKLLPVSEVVAELGFITTNKKRYAMHMASNLRELTKADFMVLEDRIGKFSGRRK